MKGIDFYEKMATNIRTTPQYRNIIRYSSKSIKRYIYNTINKTSSDDIITHNAKGYTNSQGYKYNSIYEYLGY
jgi:hypothetical protein